MSVCVDCSHELQGSASVVAVSDPRSPHLHLYHLLHEGGSHLHHHPIQHLLPDGSLTAGTRSLVCLTVVTSAMAQWGNGGGEGGGRGCVRGMRS